MKIIAVGWNYRGHNAEMNQKEYEAYNIQLSNQNNPVHQILSLIHI